MLPASVSAVLRLKTECEKINIRKREATDKLKKLIRENKYILFLLYWPVYLICFFTIDRIETGHYLIVCPLDKLIPFNEYFVIAYALWFVWFPGCTFFFLWHSLRPWLRQEGFFGVPSASDSRTLAEADRARADFVKLCTVMFSSMTLSLIIYVVFPNAIDLREPITGTNICAGAVELIRMADTPYGVCPSIHIATITAEALVIRDSRLEVLKPALKTAAYIVTLLITWSTMAIKQHSIIDVIAGAALAWIIYKVYTILMKAS